MIEGAVNGALQAVVGLPLRGPTGRDLEVEAVVDTAPLVGMALLARHSLCVDIEAGARLTIEATA